jgi:hypothetical protein
MEGIWEKKHHTTISYFLFTKLLFIVAGFYGTAVSGHLEGAVGVSLALTQPLKDECMFPCSYPSSFKGSAPSMLHT